MEISLPKQVLSVFMRKLGALDASPSKVKPESNGFMTLSIKCSRAMEPKVREKLEELLSIPPNLLCNFCGNRSIDMQVLIAEDDISICKNCAQLHSEELKELE